MPSESRNAASVRATFDAAADHYDHPAQAHWAFTAARTLEVAALEPGERVLDVCCGSGSSAIPAARQVAPDGEVVGVDLSEPMLDLAREKQRAEGVERLRFERGDMLALPHAENAFDVVLCQLGLFFLEEPAEGMTALLRHVRPGGRLVVTTFLGAPLAPAAGFLRKAIAEENDASASAGGASPARPSATSTAEGMHALADAAGATAIEVVTCEHAVELADPDDYWSMALGGGARGLIDGLTDAARERVRTRVTDQLRDDHIDRLTWNLLLTRVRKA